MWSDPNFAELAQEAAKGERVGSRAIDVRTINALKEVESVNLLYVPVKAETHFEQWQKEAKKEILLVGDSPAFLRSGGHIQFVQEAARIKLKVNLDALKSGRVMLNSTLLRLADTSPLP